MKKNIAVVGCGHWGKNLVRNFSELGCLSRVCDPIAGVADKYANQYSGGGDQALVDGIEGGFDYRTGFWQGVQGSDYVVVVDRGNKSIIDSITIGCFQDIRSWIWFPKEIQLFTSNDNVNFKLEKSIKNNFPIESYNIPYFLS